MMDGATKQLIMCLMKVNSEDLEDKKLFQQRGYRLDQVETKPFLVHTTSCDCGFDVPADDWFFANEETLLVAAGDSLSSQYKDTFSIEAWNIETGEEVKFKIGLESGSNMLS